MIDINNLPKYVKHRHGWIAEHIGLSIDRTCLVFIGRNDTIEWPIKYFEPATEAEYIEAQKEATNDQ
jgi:hypothetical protein